MRHVLRRCMSPREGPYVLESRVRVREREPLHIRVRVRVRVRVREGKRRGVGYCCGVNQH